MNTRQHRTQPHGVTWLCQHVHPNVIIDNGLFREPATAQIANHLAYDPGVAVRDITRL